MATPVWEKVWEMVLNTTVGTSSDAASDNADYIFQLGLVLKDPSFTVPCGTWGSSNGAGVCGNGDGVDRWTSAANIVFAATGNNHSWYVFTLPGIGGNAAVCVDLCNWTNYYWDVIVSPAAGFGAANGGADGTATQRPTATDEIAMSGGINAHGGSSGAWQGKLHVWRSSDGKCLRVALMRSGVNVGLFAIDVPKSPIAAWTNPVFTFARADAGSTSCATWQELYNSGYFLTSGRWLNASVETFRGGQTPTIYFASVAMDVPATEWIVQKMIGLWDFTAGSRGKWGELYDWYLGAGATVTAGDSYPGDGSCFAYQIGAGGGVVLPGDGTGVALQVA